MLNKTAGDHFIAHKVAETPERASTHAPDFLSGTKLNPASSLGEGKQELRDSFEAPPPPPLPGKSLSRNATSGTPKKWGSVDTGPTDKAYLTPPKAGLAERRRAIDPGEQVGDVARLTKHQLNEQVVVDYNDTPNLLKNFRFMLHEPVHQETKTRADALVKEIRVSNENLTSKENIDKLKTERMGGSSTMKDTNKHAVTARRNWEVADALVHQKAVDPSFKATSKNILQLISEINVHLEKDIDEGGGHLRVEKDVAAGDIGGLGGDTAAPDMYLPGAEVKNEMYALADHVSRGLKEHDNPIELAATAYQTMLSIHPFHNSNGRSARFLMDFILERSGLPPVSLGEAVNAAVFPRINPEVSVTTTAALNLVMKGVLNSYQKMKQ